MKSDTEQSQQEPSKSQLKRDAQALQKLGASLLDIPETDWHSLILPDELVSALREAKKIRSHSAYKRQLQFIGKLMRTIDPEPIRNYLEQQWLEKRRKAEDHQRLELIRDELIKNGDTAVNSFMELHPDADRQKLRQLVRQARKETEAGKPPKFSRALFRYLRQL